MKIHSSIPLDIVNRQTAVSSLRSVKQSSQLWSGPFNCILSYVHYILNSITPWFSSWELWLSLRFFMAIDYFLNYTLDFLYLSSSGSANAQLLGFFCPWTFSLNIGLNVLPLDSFMLCLHSLIDILCGSSRLCSILSLWRLVPWIDHLPPVCWSTFWKTSLK